VHASCEDKSGDLKDSYCEELGRVFDQFHRCDMTILLGDFNAKVGRKSIFKSTNGNESSHETSNGNGVRVLNFVKPKNLVAKSTMLPHRSINKYKWSSPDGKTYSQIDHIIIDRRQHSSVLHVTYFGRLIVTVTIIWQLQKLGRD
jgi:hypothetical protein